MLCAVAHGGPVGGAFPRARDRPQYLEFSSTLVPRAPISRAVGFGSDRTVFRDHRPREKGGLAPWAGPASLLGARSRHGALLTLPLQDRKPSTQPAERGQDRMQRVPHHGSRQTARWQASATEARSCAPAACVGALGARALAVLHVSESPGAVAAAVCSHAPHGDPARLRLLRGPIMAWAAGGPRFRRAGRVPLRTYGTVSRRLALGVSKRVAANSSSHGTQYGSHGTRPPGLGRSEARGCEQQQPRHPVRQPHGTQYGTHGTQYGSHGTQYGSHGTQYGTHGTRLRRSRAPPRRVASLPGSRQLPRRDEPCRTERHNHGVAARGGRGGRRGFSWRVSCSCACRGAGVRPIRLRRRKGPAPPRRG